MSDDKKPQTNEIFTDSRDQQLMQEWKTAYIDAFRSQSSDKFAQHPIDPSHQEVPDALNITLEKRPRFFGLTDKEVGCLPVKLTSSQLKPAFYRDTSEVFTSAINCHLSKSLIAEGTNYIDSIENAILERKTRHPFVDIHRPDYYFIFVMCQRVKALCRTGETATLVNEYACLLDFLNRATTIAQSYLTASGDVHPFHRYLQQAHRLLTRMKRRTIFYVERMAMVTALGSTMNSLDTYRAELAVYLMYAVSNAPLNDGLNLSQLTDDKRSLPEEFINSPIYTQLRCAVKKASRAKRSQGLPTVEKLEPGEMGISELLWDYAQKSENHRKQVDTALQAYQQLVQALCLLSRFISNLRALVKATQSQGEYQVVHDTTLSTTLNAHLLWIDFFFSGCQQAMKCINDQNQRLLRGRENLKRGATGNIKRAQEQTDFLLAISQPVIAHRQYINQRIEKIRALNPKVLVAERNALFRKTARLLTETQNNAIIPEQETAKLLAELQKNCPQKEIEMDNVGSSSKETTTSQSLESNAGMRNSSENKGDTTLRETFPDIYALIDKHPEWQPTFESTLNALYAEIDDVLPSLIEKLEKIYQMGVQLDIALKTISAIPDGSVNGSHFTEIYDQFKKFSALISETHYQNHRFNNFRFLTDLMPKWVLTKIKKAIGSFQDLLKLADEKNQQMNPRQTLPSKSLGFMLLDNLTQKKMEAVNVRIDELKQTIPKQSVFYRENLVEYYQGRIKEQVARIPQEEAEPLLVAVEPRKHSDDLVISPIPVEAPSKNDSITTSTNFERELPKAEKPTTSLLAIDNLTDVFRASNHREIQALCADLFSGNLNALEMKNKMDRLVNLLATINYTFNYGGGEWIKPNDRETKNKVPKHIAKIFGYYNLVMRHGHRWTLGDLIALRNQLFSIVSQAAKQPPTFCFFLPLRDKQNTQVIYNKMAESASTPKRLAELSVLCNKLYADGNITEIKEQLGALMQSLLDLPYELNYFSSEKLSPNGQATRKLPHPIKAAFKTFQKKIKAVKTPEEAQQLRDTILTQIQESITNPLKVCCGLFSPTYCETTKKVCNIISEYTKAQESLTPKNQW